MVSLKPSEVSNLCLQLFQLIHHGGPILQALNFTGMGGNIGVYEAYDT